MSIFVRDIDEYQRDFDIQESYYRQTALGLARKFNRPFEECLDYVKTVTSSDALLGFEDPPMKYIGRDDNGDRQFMVTSFLKFLNTVEKNDLIMSPSMTVYLPPKVKRSLSAKYIRVNVANRNRQKHEKFLAGEAGDNDLKNYKDNEQKTSKIKNNALSGAHNSESTVLFMPTIHSSLTSTCRTATGYANANNEKVLAGNRHYWSPDIVEANIVAICDLADLTLLEKVMGDFNLTYPSTDNVVNMVVRSSEHYWRDSRRQEDIVRLIDGLTPLEKAAVLYIGDLYHVRELNSQFMRTFLEKLSQRPTQAIDNPKEHVEALISEEEALVGLLCPDLTGGKALGSFDKMDEANKGHVGATAKHVKDVLNEYRDFIKVMLVSDVMPASVAHLPTVIRRVALTSDTDSTIYTVQEWKQWYGGEISFRPDLVNIGHAISFLTSTSITHLLAKMSANMGVAKEQLHQYAMKSEFYFPVFALTGRAKTYFAFIGAQEGQVYDDYEIEMKGVVFKGSNSPQFITDAVNEMIRNILQTVRDDKELDLAGHLKDIADMERMIFESLRKGDVMFYKTGEVKPAEGYKREPVQSPYFHYMLWKEVFGDKYGDPGEPPYGCLKVSIDIKTKKDFQAYLDRINDPAIKERLCTFLAKHNKAMPGSFMIPRAIVESNGIPDEIIQAISTRQIVSNLMEPFMVLLETLGYYILDGKQLRLVSDIY